jgi:hypothetical protein
MDFHNIKTQCLILQQPMQHLNVGKSALASYSSESIAMEDDVVDVQWAGMRPN